MKHSSIHRTAVGILAVGALLTACSAEEATLSSGQTGDGATEVGSTDAGPAVVESPLDAYLGLVSVDERDVVAQRTAIEEAVAQCMADEGFQYLVPDVAAQYSDAVHGSEEDWGTREWVSTHGYGITEKAGETAPGVSDPEQTDPQAAYVESLSDASAAAYVDALLGDVEELEESEETATAGSAEDRGCMGKAEEQEAPADAWADPRFTSLREAVRTMREATDSSAEVAAADAFWADCMADAGHPGLARQADAPASISAAQDAVWAAVDVSSDPAARPAPDVQAELNGLEVATALADLTCREEVGYDTTLRDVRFAAEEQFIVDHRSELDELLAAAGS